MIKSMTGYGRSELSSDTCKVSVEIKSVNNRYLDIGIKMPRALNPLEARIRKLLKFYVQRGKVDVFISYEDLAESNVSIKYNRKLAEEYLRYMNQMSEEFGLDKDTHVSTLARFPDVFTKEEESLDEEKIWRNLEEVLKDAAGKFLDARIREGEYLKQDLLAKLDLMQENVNFITARSPEIVELYRTRLYEKVKDLLDESTIDNSRIVQEVTMYADKVSVDEELVRLASHIEATRDALEQEEGVGRKLDFIAQEMNRESNTILSKSDDREIADRAIELKTTVEKVREQIQNIE